MFELGEKPLSLARRPRRDEPRGGMKGLYYLLKSSSEGKGEKARDGQIRCSPITKQELCDILGLYADKLEFMLYMDNQARKKTADGLGGAGREKSARRAEEEDIIAAKAAERAAAAAIIAVKKDAPGFIARCGRRGNSYKRY